MEIPYFQKKECLKRLYNISYIYNPDISSIGYKMYSIYDIFSIFACLINLEITRNGKNNIFVMTFIF